MSVVNLAIVAGFGRSFLMAELFDYQIRVRVYETLTCEQFIPRVRELESHGAAFWMVKVLNHNRGYTIQCDLPGDKKEFITGT